VIFGKPLAAGPLPTLLVVASAADVPGEITARDADELREAMERWLWRKFRVVQGRWSAWERTPRGAVIRAARVTLRLTLKLQT
jgi:hypothetical protein